MAARVGDGFHKCIKFALLARSSTASVPLRTAASSLQASRAFSSGEPRFKALENWKKPNMDEYPVPKESWRTVHDRNQKTNSIYLLAGVIVLGATIAFGRYKGYLFLYTTPEYAKTYSKKFSSNEDVSTSMSLSSSTSSSPEATAASTSSTAQERQSEQVEESNKKNEEIPITSVSNDQLNLLPSHVPYLLIGGGTASFAAMRAIRAKDPKAKIIIVSAEKHKPYMRPPLSKELWFGELAPPEFEGDLRFIQWNGRPRSLFFEPSAFYCNLSDLENSTKGGISVVTGHKVVRLDPSKQLAFFQNGKSIHYDKCLLATGGKPKLIKPLDNSSFKEKVTVYRTLEDFQVLNERLPSLKKVAIIGGGFLGSELACALGNKGKLYGTEVIQLFPEQGNMAKVLPDYLSEWTTNKVVAEGVNVMPNTRVKSALVNSFGKLVLTLEDGQQLVVDHAIVATGIEPNTELAKDSRLEVDDQYNGFRVNAELEARTNLWVAGDAASFYDITLGRRRVEHHDHAVVSGRLAGENMVSPPEKRKPYTHQSMFWSDLGPDIGYEAIGLVDSKLDTVGVFAKATESDTPKAVSIESGSTIRSEVEEKKVHESNDTAQEEQEEEDVGVQLQDGEKYGKGVIFYLKNNAVVGIVMWNVFGRMSVARKIIRENRQYEDLSELAKLFDIHGRQSS